MMHLGEQGREARRPGIGRSDIADFIRRMGVVCDAESRLAVGIQSLDRQHDHIGPVKLDGSALDVPRWRGEAR